MKSPHKYGKDIWWWKDPRNPRVREDSARLAAYTRAEAQKIIAKKDSFTTMPVGMMDQGVNATHLLYTDSYTNATKGTDPGVDPNCACILTENFFADYTTGGPSYNDDANYKTMSNGRYQNGRAWLESDEGLNAIADIHVGAIVNYINSLS